MINHGEQQVVRGRPPSEWPILRPFCGPDSMYPDSDGEPIAENSKQAEWIVKLFENLTQLFVENADVYVAMDQLIYAEEHRPEKRRAPDVFVAFGAKQGHRGSYKVWEEGGLFPQVIIEVLSPGNKAKEMEEKFEFYESNGAEEYYIYDPDTNELQVWFRNKQRLKPVKVLDGLTSPRMGIRFVPSETPIRIEHPQGGPFERLHEVSRRAKDEQMLRKQAEREGRLHEKARAEAEERERIAEALRLTEARARSKAEQQREAEAKARAEEAKARAEAEERERIEAKARAEAEQQREAEAKARAEAEEREQIEAKARADAEVEIERLRLLMKSLGIDPNKPV